MGTLTWSLFLKKGHNQIIISEQALKKYDIRERNEQGNEENYTTGIYINVTRHFKHGYLQSEWLFSIAEKLFHIFALLLKSSF
jgi:hypothetical protein